MEFNRTQESINNLKNKNSTYSDMLGIMVDLIKDVRDGRSLSDIECGDSENAAVQLSAVSKALGTMAASMMNISEISEGTAKKLQDTRSAISALDESLTECAANISDCNSEIETLNEKKSELSDKKKEYDRLSGLRSQLETEINNYRNMDIPTEENAIEKMRKQSDELMKKRDELRRQKQKLTAVVNENNEEIKSLDSEIKELSDKKNANDKIINERKKLLSEIDNYSTVNIHGEELENEKLASRLSQLENVYQNRLAEKQELNKKIIYKNELIVTETAEMNEFKLKISELEQRYIERQNEIAGLKKECDARQSEYDSAEKEYRICKETFERLNSRERRNKLVLLTNTVKKLRKITAKLGDDMKEFVFPQTCEICMKDINTGLDSAENELEQCRKIYVGIIDKVQDEITKAEKEFAK